VKKVLVACLLVVSGVVVGGYVFRDVQPRSLLAMRDCGGSCYKLNDLAGLLASVGIQRVPGLLPLVLRESEQCITIRHPFPAERTHFVVFPKRDIKDIGSISGEDTAALMECMGHIGWLVKTYNLKDYKVETNGPERQHVTYLHFHLVASEGVVVLAQ
jgi:hypothetical protein